MTFFLKRPEDFVIVQAAMASAAARIDMNGVHLLISRVSLSFTGLKDDSREDERIPPQVIYCPMKNVTLLQHPQPINEGDRCWDVSQGKLRMDFRFCIIAMCDGNAVSATDEDICMAWPSLPTRGTHNKHAKAGQALACIEYQEMTPPTTQVRDRFV